MNFKEMVTPPTSVLKVPLDYEENFRECLESARMALAALCVEHLVDLYNHTKPDMSFADYLVNEVRTLMVLEQLDPNAHGLKDMDLNDNLLGTYIEGWLKELARMYELTDLDGVTLTRGGYETALRFIKRR